MAYLSGPGGCVWQGVGFAAMILLMVVYTSGCRLDPSEVYCSVKACLPFIASCHAILTFEWR